MDTNHLNQVATKGNLTCMEPQNGQHLGHCGEAKSQVSECEKAKEEVCGCVKSAVHHNNKDEGSITKQCYKIHSARKNDSPDRASLLP